MAYGSRDTSPLATVVFEPAVYSTVAPFIGAELNDPLITVPRTPTATPQIRFPHLADTSGTIAA